MALSHYQVDPVTGFVSPDPLPLQLPSAYAAWDAVAHNIAWHKAETADESDACGGPEQSVQE